jgi:hypothetical protein
LPSGGGAAPPSTVAGGRHMPRASASLIHETNNERIASIRPRHKVHR